MARVITLKYAGTCVHCGWRLRRGTRAKWYGGGRVACVDCEKSDHEVNHGRYDGRTAYERGDRSPGAVASHFDRYGVYLQDGSRIGCSCGCIDYPCCGH